MKVTPTALLVADIGGTHARFALAAPGDGVRPVLGSIREFEVAQFRSLPDAITNYLEFLQHTGASRPTQLALGVASAVTGEQIELTNHSWSFSLAQLRRDFGFEKVEAINDCAAMALSIPHLQGFELEAIGSTVAQLAAPKSDRRTAAIGVGTGLGVCGLMLRDGCADVVESEAGHINFAPGSEAEADILRLLWSRHPRVSAERLLSGAGLQNLYSAVCAIAHSHSPAAMDSPRAIIASAESGADAECRRAVELFCAILGSFAGDVALIYGAWVGIYLGGSIPLALLAWIQRGSFRERFEDKGRFGERMRAVPTLAILHPQPGLLGAGAWALMRRDRLQNRSAR